MSLVSWFLGRDSSPTTKNVYTARTTPTIIDPRKLSMVKAHTIVGSIESAGHSMRQTALTDWLKANELVISTKVLKDDEYLSSHKMMLYPATKGGCFAYGPGCFGDKQPDENVYILGDTHGDFDSLVAIFDTILDTAKVTGNTSPIVYLLGDILDRNGESCMVESLFLMAIMQKSLPEQFAQYNEIRLGIIKGDHDIGLSYEEPYSPEKRFVAAVKPADYCDWLNNRLETNKTKNQEQFTLVGRAWIKLMTMCPAAAFLDDSGTLLSHGGIPRLDLQQKMREGLPFIMQSSAVAQDFEWCRMVDAKNKLLNRGSKTSEIGFVEFDLFNQLLNGRIKKFIFGHQHPLKGFMRFDKYYTGYDVMCLSSFRNDDTVGGPTIPHYCKLNKDEANIYSLCPAKYVIRLEESSTTAVPKTPALPKLPTSPVATIKPTVNVN